MSPYFLIVVLRELRSSFCSSLYDLVFFSFFLYLCLYFVCECVFVLVCVKAFFCWYASSYLMLINGCTHACITRSPNIWKRQCTTFWNKQRKQEAQLPLREQGVSFVLSFHHNFWRYGDLLVENRRFSLPPFIPRLRFSNTLNILIILQEAKSEHFMTIACVVLTQYSSVTSTHTETDGGTPLL